MSTAAPFILFVPSYGRGGSGEFVRSVALAQATARRWPTARIEFLLPGGPGTRQDAPFPRTCHDGPEDTKAAFDNQHLERLRPNLAIFDSGCRSTTLRLCRRLGIKTAYISDREGTCRKAFRFDWLFLLDEHWHQREHLTAAAFTPSQRLRVRFSRTHRRHFDTYLAAAPADESDLPSGVRAALAEPFVLFSAGGGGYRVNDQPVSELFAEAATRIQTLHGIRTLTLMGPLYDGSLRESVDGTGPLRMRSVSLGRSVQLIRQACITVCNGGHTLNQAMACAAAVVAAPLGGGDQPERIAAYRQAGLIQAALPTVEQLVAAVEALLDTPKRNAQRARVHEIAATDGMPVMVNAIGEMLGLA